MQSIPWWHDLGSFEFPYSSSQILVQTHAPNFGIKVILFQNYHVCTTDTSMVMGRESWSRAYYLSPSLAAHEPMLQSFMRAPFLHGRLDPSFQTDYKCLSDSGESNSTTQLCFSSACFLECLWLHQNLHGLIPCYEGLEWLEEFLCIGWLCRSFQCLVEQEDQSLWLEELLCHHLSFLTTIAELY